MTYIVFDGRFKAVKEPCHKNKKLVLICFDKNALKYRGHNL